MSALLGDNVVERSAAMPWYTGPSLLEHLETVPVAFDGRDLPARFPVQWVVRPDAKRYPDFRGFAGQIASGRIRVGDAVTALPSGHSSRVSRIVTFDGDLDEAFAPLSVTLELEDELDIARGDTLAHASAAPHLARRLVANVVWMNEHPLAAGATWLLQQGPRTVPARVTRILHRWDVERLAPEDANSLRLNDIGQVEIETAEPLVFDSYRDNRSTGGFVLVDPITNLTMAAGLVERAAASNRRRKAQLSFQSAAMTAAERAALFGHQAAHVDLSSRPPLAHLAERTLLEQPAHVFVRQDADLPVAPLLAAGLIVLDTLGGGAKAIDASGLSQDDDEAVLELIERLRRAGVFLDHDAVNPGEGI
jgi:sulfate adenylyltransferase subunit 1 (EFTu-like GTPase family)